VRSRGPSRRYLLLKRTFDVVLCLGLLLVCLPVLALCALAVRLNSPGPIVFSQLRTGRDGRRFRMYKFRTMVANAEELKASLAHLNVLPAPDFKIPDDPRITRVGKLLRATSLDELPQLFNVLRGDMSLVGPRPTSFAPSTYDTWHTHRLDVPPGLTGLWQVEGRHTMTFDDRLRLDVQYIRRASITYDLVLLARTVRVVARRSGA
jgi:lipopolysaccharide/colanic/teichoic acid biosynthesis glycosyltransferase